MADKKTPNGSGYEGHLSDLSDNWLSRLASLKSRNQVACGTRHNRPGTQIRPDSAGVTSPQSPTKMKVAFLSLLALVSVALAVPSYDSQSVFGISEQDTHEIPEVVNSIFDKAEDKVKQWVQDGRDFINHNGLTCQSSLAKS